MFPFFFYSIRRVLQLIIHTRKTLVLFKRSGLTWRPQQHPTFSDTVLIDIHGCQLCLAGLTPTEKTGIEQAAVRLDTLQTGHQVLFCPVKLNGREPRSKFHGYFHQLKHVYLCWYIICSISGNKPIVNTS